MPLAVFNRNADQSIARVPGDIEGTTKPSVTLLTLDGEMTDEDFCPEHADFSVFGVFNWFSATFNERVLHVPEDPKFDVVKRRLASFLSSKINGAYYVQEGFENTRATLHIVFFDPADANKFAEQYPKWHLDDRAADKNDVLLTKRLEAGWQPESARLQRLVASR